MTRLQGRMRRLTERAVEMADACLFVIDGRVGVTPTDEVFADILRKKNARVFLAVNKAEGKAGDAGALEAYSLGLGEPIRISAEHGEGMDDLYRELKPLEGEFAEREAENAPEVDIDLSEEEAELEADETAHYPTAKKPLQIAVIGRPNAGKSTLINKILGYDRLLTGPEAGITRDAISVRAELAGHPDPHFRHRRHAQEGPDHRKAGESSASPTASAPCALPKSWSSLLDVEIPFEVQDLRIADFAETEGRAVVVAVNKWDLEDEKQEKLAELKEMFERLLPQLRGAPLITVSAKTGRGLDRLHDAIRKAHDVWNRRIPTAKLNTWLGAMTEAHPPPAPGGHRIKLRYMTQAKTRPPGFMIKCSRPDELPESYKRYLVNGLRDHFDMPGTPIRLFLRSQGNENPWKERKFHTPSRLRKHKEKNTGQ
jgi:GTP-binding protein